MTQYYIAATGSNGNPGTVGLPWATLNHAMPLLAPGDILYLRGGTYGQSIDSVYLVDFASGTAGNLITVRNYPGEAVTLNGYIHTYTKSYLAFIGFEINATGFEFGIVFTANNHVRFQDIEVHHAGTSNILSGTNNGPNTYIEFININSHHCGQFGANPGAPSHGLYMSTSHANNDTVQLIQGPFLIEGGEFHDNTSDPNSLGITFYDSSLSGFTDVTIRGVRIYNNEDGIQAGSGQGHIVENCLIYDNHNRGLGWGYGTASDAKCYHNVIFHNGWDGILVAGPTFVDFKNNIIKDNGYTFGGYGINAVTGTHVANNNCFLGNASGTTYGSFSSLTGNFFSDPLFVNEGSGQFRLQSASPCIGVGVDIADMDTDFDGFGWLDPRSVGAYEFGSTVIPDPDPDPEPEPDPDPDPDPDPEPDPGETEPTDPEVFPVLTNIIDSFDSVRFENKIHAVTQERTSGRVGYHVFNMATKLWEIVNQEVVTSNSDGDIGVTICVRSSGEPCIAFRGDREAGGPADYHGMEIAAAGDYLRCYVTRLVDEVWTTPEMIGSPNDLVATFFPSGTLYNGAVNIRMGRAIAEQDNWVRFVFTVEEPADVANTADLYTQLLRPDDTLTQAYEFEFTGGLGYTATCVVGDPCVFQYAGDWYTAVPVGLLIYPAIYIWQGVGTLGDATFEIPLVDSTTGVQTIPDTYTTLNPPIGVRWFKDKLYVVMGTRQGSTLEWAALKTISPPFSAVDPDALSAPREEQVGPTWPNATYARHGVEFVTIRGKDYLFKCTTGNFGVPGSSAKSILEKIDLDADVPGDNGYLLAEWLADNG